jgi:hypothetical protein
MACTNHEVLCNFKCMEAKGKGIYRPCNKHDEVGT